MANRIQIRRGSAVPTTSQLLVNELGWCTSNKRLYINDNGAIRTVTDGYLPLSGGAMTGSLKTKANFLVDCGTSWGCMFIRRNYQNQSSSMRIQMNDNEVPTIEYFNDSNNLPFSQIFFYENTIKFSKPILNFGILGISNNKETDIKIFDSVSRISGYLRYRTINSTNELISQFHFIEMSYSDTSRLNTYEIYDLPICNKNRTNNGHYSILTTKNLVAISQGGTGASTAHQACANLGAVRKNGDTMTGTLTIQPDTLTDYREFRVVRKLPNNITYGAVVCVSGNSSIQEADLLLYDVTNSVEKNKLSLRTNNTVLSKPLTVSSGGTGASSGSQACANLGAVKKSGDIMTGNLAISNYLYPSLVMLPTDDNGTTNRTVFEGSYTGTSSFSAWQDSTGNNRRMVEVRNRAAAASLDSALVLRDVVNGSYSTHRVFHSGMPTPVPVVNGGTGASSGAGARANLGIPKVLYGSAPKFGASGSGVPGDSYRDGSVTFSSSFSTVPTVVIGFRNESEAGTFGRCCVAVLNTTTTGFTFRFHNGDSSMRNPDFTWIACGT